MSSPPHTKAEAEKVLYEGIDDTLAKSWEKSQHIVSIPYSDLKCAYTIARKYWHWLYPGQCSRKPKYGPAKLYCKQHAKKVGDK